MINRHFLISVIMLVPFTGIAQENLKTVTEDFQGGKITYTYYEDESTGNYVKHGTFKFIKKEDGYNALTTGTFKNGMRDGAWTYKISSIDYPNSMGSFTTRTMNATLTYKDGMPNGLWQLSDFAKARNKMLGPNNTFRWSNYETIANDNVTMTFKDGSVIGTVNYKTNGKSKTYTLNEFGYAIGTINTTNYLGIETITFKDGIVIKDIVRDGTGKVIDSDSFILENEETWLAIAKKYMKGEISETDIIKLGADIYEKQLGESIDVETMFQHDYFYLQSIGGDKTLQEGSSFSTRNYGKYIVIKPIGIVHYYEHPKWSKYGFTPIADYKGITNEEILTDVEFLINNCSNNLYPGDIAILKDFVQRYHVAKDERTKQQEIQKIRSEYEEISKNLSENIQERIQYINKMNKDFVNLYAPSSLNAIYYSNVQNPYEDDIVAKNALYIVKLLSDSINSITNKYRNINPSTNVLGYTDLRTIEKKMENIDWAKRLSDIKTKEKEASITFTSLNSNIETISSNLKKLSDEISTVNKEYGISSQKDSSSSDLQKLLQSKKKAPQIYLQYSNIINELLHLMMSKKDFSEINSLLETEILLSKKVLEYKNQDNKSRIKILKKTESIDEKIRVFTE